MRGSGSWMWATFRRRAPENRAVGRADERWGCVGIYGDGKRRREINLDALGVGLKLAEGEFAWIGLLEPNEDEASRPLQERFDLHPLAVEDALKARQLPKVDVHGGKA